MTTMPPPATPGHLFILRGDLTRLACDAWLLPANRQLHLMPQWEEAVAAHADLGRLARGLDHLRAGQATADLDLPDPAAPWGPNAGRVLRLRRWPEDVPQPWITLSGRSAMPPTWYAEGARQFLAAVRAHGPKVSRFRRPRPLAALPVLGTGAGGGMKWAGEILTALMPILAEACRAGLDVALVTHGAQHHAAAQAARARCPQYDWWPTLTPDQRAEAARLADHAREGNLALFLGAGVSFNAGLPTWQGLLDALGDQLRPPLDAGAKERLRRLDYLDQAEVLHRRLARTGTALHEAIRSAVGGDRFRWHTLAHGLLAGLPVREAITTNYDQLFEAAWDGAGREPAQGLTPLPPPAVLPYEEPQAGCRWLLKMHGCLSRPEDIVLTRPNFIGYGERRGALAGLVQAMMLTRHLLFVGFSLDDYNFHRIIHTVRQAKTDPARRLGTVLMLGQDPFREELWQDDLAHVALDPREETALRDHDRREKEAAGRERRAPALALPEVGRRLEIFLDYVAAQVQDAAHLLDPRFAPMLDDGDQALAEALRLFAGTVPRGQRGGQVWAHFRAFLRRLGHEVR